MVLQFVGEYVAAFLLKTPFLTKRGFLFYPRTAFRGNPPDSYRD